MIYQEKFASNEGVSICYYHSDLSEDSIPLIIIPGMVNTAEEVKDAIGGRLLYPHIIISVRGRGKSDSPESGYTLDDQARDVLAVLDHAGVHRFFVFGHSVGSTIGIRAAALRPTGVQGIIMGDFAPFYPPFGEQWGERVLSYGIHMTRTAVEGIIRDASYQDVLEDLNSIAAPVLALRADGPDTLLQMQDAERLQQLCPRCEVAVIEQSGHELLQEAPDYTLNIITRFLEERQQNMP